MTQTLAFAFRRRYNLPPTDPRFLDATTEEMVLDYWAHRHADDPNLRNEIIAEGYDDDLEAMMAESIAKEEAAIRKADRDNDWEEI
jgi:hypothetical protein